MTVTVFDDRICVLGEGPLWHPQRKQLFWFNILEKTMLTRENGNPLEWTFEDTVSAAGWIDQNTLFMASASGLWRVSLSDGSRDLIIALEADDATTRSNDGRADPWGGFWIGTMGYKAEPGAGAIYRYHRGMLRKLFSNITISNAICFSPDRSCAYYSDTATRKVMKVALDEEGWPKGQARVFLDLSEDSLNPDGAIVDAQGTVWLAQWGVSRVAAYNAQGSFVKAIDLPASQITCPSFGGEDLNVLYVTSATEGLDPEALKEAPLSGKTFAIEGFGQGLPEPRVIL